MPIIVPSNHTRIGAWVNSYMSGRNPLLIVSCTISLIAMQGYRTNTKDTGSLGYNSVCYTTSRIGWVSLKEIYRYKCRRVCLFVCVVSSHSFWTSGSLDVPAGVTQEEKVTQDVSSTFFLRCVPQFFSREGFSHSFPSSTVKSNFVY